MHVVTGSGRSGTSFVSQILSELGAEFLGNLDWDKESRAGLENKEIVDINKLMFSINQLNHPHAIDWLTPKQKDHCLNVLTPMIEYIDIKFDAKWIKDPLFTKTLDVWHSGGLKIETLVICTRNPWDMASSANKTSKGFSPVSPYDLDQIHSEMNARAGNIRWIAESRGIEYIVVRYEHMAEDIVEMALSVFPGIEIEVINKLISDKWKPRTQKSQLPSLPKQKETQPDSSND